MLAVRICCTLFVCLFIYLSECTVQRNSNGKFSSTRTSWGRCRHKVCQNNSVDAFASAEFKINISAATHSTLQRKYFRFLFLFRFDSLTSWHLIRWCYFDTSQLMQLLHELSTVFCYWHIKQVQARTFSCSLESCCRLLNFLCNTNYVRDAELW